MSTAHYSTIICPIVNRNFCNTFHHHTVPNQCSSYTYSYLHPSTIIYTPLSEQRPFTCTRKHLSYHSQTPTQDKYHFLISCRAGTLHLVLHPVVGSLHLLTHGITGNLNYPRHWALNLLFQIVLWIHC